MSDDSLAGGPTLIHTNVRHILEPAIDNLRLSTQVYTHLPSRGEQKSKKWIQYGLDPLGSIKKKKNNSQKFPKPTFPTFSSSMRTPGSYTVRR
jgi:hypothetical protein